jgi:outer membrane protein TolC
MALPRIVPSHSLSSSVPKIDKQALMRDAVANRIEYKQAQEQLTVQDIKVRFAKNQAWPRLDVFATLGANGLRSTAGNALTDAFEGSTPAWSAGIALTIPLGNRQAKAQLTEAQAQKEQLLLNFKQLEIDLALQVDIAVARVQTSQKRLDTARQSVTAANSTLDGELKRMEQGVGVSFTVLEAQKELAAASSRELAARADLNKSLVDLWLAAGTLLDRHHIYLGDDSKPPPHLTPMSK